MKVPILSIGATVFLDRDGTINVSPDGGEYLDDPADVVLIPGSGEAIAELNSRGNPCVVVTNQRGISRGLMTAQDLRDVNQKLVEMLSEKGARVEGIYYCPHAVGVCDCRKPGSGMFIDAAREIACVSIEGAVMIGDSKLDVEAGRALGMTTVLVGEAAGSPTVADYSAPDLRSAVELLI